MRPNDDRSDAIDVKSLMMSNFQRRKRINGSLFGLKWKPAVILFHCDERIFSDVHQAVYCVPLSEPAPRELESEKGTELN